MTEVPEETELLQRVDKAGNMEKRDSLAPRPSCTKRKKEWGGEPGTGKTWRGLTGDPGETQRRGTVRGLRRAAEGPTGQGWKEGVGGKGEAQKESGGDEGKSLAWPEDSGSETLTRAPGEEGLGAATSRGRRRGQRCLSTGGQAKPQRQHPADQKRRGDA